MNNGAEHAVGDSGHADRGCPGADDFGHEVGVDKPGEDRNRHVECRQVGHAQPAHELRPNALLGHPLGDGFAAAVDNNRPHPPLPQLDDIIDRRVPFAECRAADLNYDAILFRHYVVYAELKTTYSSVRSQPQASPKPSPQFRLVRSSTSCWSRAAITLWGLYAMALPSATI